MARTSPPDSALKPPLDPPRSQATTPNLIARGDQAVTAARQLPLAQGLHSRNFEDENAQPWFDQASVHPTPYFQQSPLMPHNYMGQAFPNAHQQILSGGPGSLIGTEYAYPQGIEDGSMQLYWQDTALGIRSHSYPSHMSVQSHYPNANNIMRNPLQQVLASPEPHNQAQHQRYNQPYPAFAMPYQGFHHGSGGPIYPQGHNLSAMHSSHPSKQQNLSARNSLPSSTRPQFVRISAERGNQDSPSEPIPSYPRGPPRKPKQSGFALWVGNLPPGASIIELKEHFSRGAFRDIESVFLISKSNCAFVNYRTAESCKSAMVRFHESRFRGVRLVCRLRAQQSNSISLTKSVPAPEEHDKDGRARHSSGKSISNAPETQDFLAKLAGEEPDGEIDGVDGRSRSKISTDGGGDGLDGIDGLDRVDGEHEVDGVVAVDGVDGLDGADGEHKVDSDGMVDGINGVEGSNGVDGVDGMTGGDDFDQGRKAHFQPDGIDGKDGVNSKSAKHASHGRLTNINGSDGLHDAHGTHGMDEAHCVDGTGSGIGGHEQHEYADEKYFVAKSLTLQDLNASVRNGIWATQSHNEAALNIAFKTARTVYLVFSANKSGEYFGYARMRSAISDDSVTANPRASVVNDTFPDGPTSNPTTATEFAPKGRVIDDSARGTIFWEAETSSDSDNESLARDIRRDSTKDSGRKRSADMHTNQDWGKPFQVEWMCTTKLPFYKTRGLRNPWNANREVKIARDGTELEPAVGRRLLDLFHQNATDVGLADHFTRHLA